MMKRMLNPTCTSMFHLSIFCYFQAIVLSKLSLHPNIISYYDSFEVDGTLMIEMEYADGGLVLFK